MKSFLVVSTLRVLHTHRLVGQLDANLTCILSNRVILSHHVPHLKQILLIVVTDLDLSRTNTGRTYHNIHTMLHSVNHQRYIKRFQEIGQSRGIKMLDVCFACPLITLTNSCLISVTVIIGPSGIQMQTEHVTLRLLQTNKQFFEVSLTVCSASRVITTCPTIAVEPHTRRIHNAMQNHVISVSVHQPFALHVERRQRLYTLCPHSHGDTGNK